MVCSSPSSWNSAFGVMLLTRSWALGKGPVRSVYTKQRPFFVILGFRATTRPRTRLLPCRVSARAENRTQKPNQALLGHKATHRYSYSSCGACFLSLFGTALRVAMSPHEARWCVSWCVCVAACSRCACTTELRLCARCASTLPLRTPRGAADTTVTATPPRDGAERTAASAVSRRAHAAAGERAKPPGSARHIGQGAHRDDATPTPGAADAAVGAAPLSPPR